MGKISQIGSAGPQQSSMDVLTEIRQTGSHRLLAAALGAEIEEFVARYTDQKDARGRQRVMRNGYHRPREVQTGLGAIEVQAPRARDRESFRGCPNIPHPYAGGFFEAARPESSPLPWPSRLLETLGSRLLPLRG